MIAPSRPLSAVDAMLWPMASNNIMSLARSVPFPIFELESSLTPLVQMCGDDMKEQLLDLIG